MDSTSGGRGQGELEAPVWGCWRLWDETQGGEKRKWRGGDHSIGEHGARHTSHTHTHTHTHLSLASSSAVNLHNVMMMSMMLMKVGASDQLRNATHNTRPEGTAHYTSSFVQTPVGQQVPVKACASPVPRPAVHTRRSTADTPPTTQHNTHQQGNGPAHWGLWTGHCLLLTPPPQIHRPLCQAEVTGLGVGLKD